MKIIGIDPGTTESGVCIIDVAGGKIKILQCEKLHNESIRRLLQDKLYLGDPDYEAACETMQCMGMAVGQEVFETCMHIGRYQQICEGLGTELQMYKRHDYARFFMGKVRKVTDAGLYQALRDYMRWQTGKEPKEVKGPSDKRSALAVAIYHGIQRGLIKGQ
jgi:hypothetical protein